MVRLKGFGFAAPPCVCGCWFLLGCEFAGMRIPDKSQLYFPPPRNYQGFTLSIVRHPLSWLNAYYKHLSLVKKEPLFDVRNLDLLYKDFKESDGRFLKFLDLYLKRHPGCIGKMFDEYRVSSVMRYEDLPWGAVEFMHSIGVMETRLFEKSTDIETCRIMQDRDLRRAVVDAEISYCEKYEYF